MNRYPRRIFCWIFSDVTKFLLESVNLSSTRNSIDIPFTNYRDARALSRAFVFSSMDKSQGRGGGYCLEGCNNEAWAIFIEIEVAHAMGLG